MAITEDVVQHVARLARLDLSREETATLSGQLSHILGIMDALSRLPTDGVEPMSHAVDLVMPMRADQVTNGDQREQILHCAPDREQGHFRVPKVIE
ncbi:MAG: Asp-tRNA(Asn)/Glu-tRNA(Gln) amidotransferase subunit GatC [Magnetococcus sp. WYHC-3]